MILSRIRELENWPLDLKMIELNLISLSFCGEEEEQQTELINPKKNSFILISVYLYVKGTVKLDFGKNR